MKKFLVTFITILIFLLPNVSKAQSKDEWVLSAGLGYSYTYNLLNKNGGSGPKYFNADYGTDDHFSLGVGISRFSIRNGGIFGQTHLTGRSTNIGTRLLWHFGDNPKLDIYTGLRLGFIISNFDDMSWHEGGLTVSIPRALFGVRNYFDNNVGFNFEVGIGQPYFFNGGIVYRIQ
jgi:hypothetical protein